MGNDAMKNDKANILLWDFGQAATHNIYKYLDSELCLKVWVGRKKNWPDPHECPAVLYDMKDFSHQLALDNRARLKQGYQHRKEYLEVYRQLKDDMNTFFYIYSRYPIHNGENRFLDMMDAFHIYIHLFIDILKTHKIDYAVFREPPHHADFLLYRIAQVLGVKTLMFAPSTEEQKAHLYNDIEHIGRFEVDDNEVTPQPIERKQRQSYTEQASFKKSLRRLLRRNRIYKMVISALLQGNLDLLTHRLLSLRRIKQFQKLYQRLAGRPIPAGKFVYFPLHYQPELTTSLLGGEYVDQIIALERLRRLLPDDWTIVAKENPIQSHHSRGVLFFERLRRIPNLVYLDKRADTFDLIERCEFLATISGTAGIEALSFGKRVLIFGNAPYQSFPGVVKYHEDLTLADIESLEFTHDELEMAHAKKQHCVVEVALAQSMVGNLDTFDAEANAQRLADCVNQFVLKGVTA